MQEFRIYQVDAFTAEPFQGNPAGVVPDARGMTAQMMQAVARELNNSETAFVIPGEQPGDDVSVRFFTPTAEVPICGHATVAAHHVLALEGGPLGRRRQHTAAGVLDVEGQQEGGKLRIWMYQRPASFEPPLEDGVCSRIMAALGLHPGDLFADHPVQIVSTGHSKVIIPVRHRSAIRSLAPDMPALARLSREIGCNGYYPFTLDDPDPGTKSHGRMFAPAIGILEDPVTGNASGCLGAYLLHHHIVDPGTDGELSFTAGQGAEKGRPGKVRVEAKRSADAASIDVRIAGEAVVVFSGKMLLPCA